jgi:hypothetical protein
VEIIITDQSKENVVLLPKTIDFYQIEITRMLETERYEEAIALLRFLGKCDSGNPNTDEEWKSLLIWLESMNSNDTQVDVTNDEDETEAELFRQHLRVKTDQDPQYITQLIEMLQPDVAVNKQMLALDQLAYVEEAADSEYNISEALAAWLESGITSPWVQFKAMQVLKIRRYQGKVLISKAGIKLKIDIAQIPLGLDEYPKKIEMVLNKLRQVAEINEPSLVYFAEEIWEQFLAFIYGTPFYEQLVQGDQALIEVWASALHSMIVELMTGSAVETDIQNQYDIPEESKLLWKQAFQSLHSFADQYPFALK